MAQAHWNTNTVIETLIETGRVALEQFQNPDVSVKHDATLVTQTDLRIEEMIRSRFADPAAGHHLIGEETAEEMDEEALGRALSEHAWIIDPIDGTACFAHGLGMWGISIGYSEAGMVTEGAILMPPTGELFLTQGDEVLYGHEGPDPTHWRFEELERMEKPRGEEPGAGIITITQDMAKRGRYTGASTVHATGSCVYSVAHLARGSYRGYVGNVKIWDIAAGLAILDKLGFVMRSLSGRPVDTRIAPELYNLEPGARRRFRVKEHIFAAPTEELCRELIENTKLDRSPRT
jgi:myo-inositol-1(or 4)-monophosphatase